MDVVDDLVAYSAAPAPRPFAGDEEPVSYAVHGRDARRAWLLPVLLVAAGLLAAAVAAVLLLSPV